MSDVHPPEPTPAGTPHPVQTLTLASYMILFLFLGVTASFLREALGVVFASIVSGALFACFLILFGVYWLGWMLRGHVQWQESSRGPSTGR